MLGRRLARNVGDAVGAACCFPKQMAPRKRGQLSVRAAERFAIHARREPGRGAHGGGQTRTKTDCQRVYKSRRERNRPLRSAASDGTLPGSAAANPRGRIAHGSFCEADTTRARSLERVLL